MLASLSLTRLCPPQCLQLLHQEPRTSSPDRQGRPRRKPGSFPSFLLRTNAELTLFLPQVELHPYLPQEKLLAYCKEKGIHLTAYCRALSLSLLLRLSTLTYLSLTALGQGNSPILREELILSLAEKYKKPVGAVLLSWNVQRGVSVVPKSSNPERMKQNLGA